MDLRVRAKGIWLGMTDLEQGSFGALIFDCDGTLVETVPAHVAALSKALAPYGLQITAEWCYARSGRSPRTVLSAYHDEIAPIPAPLEVVLADYEQGFAESLHLLREVELVAAVARRWRGRVPMAVASNGHRANVEATLRAADLRELFDTVVTVEDVRSGKPQPDLFLEAARRLGIGAAECLVFEDSDEGLQAAKAAGMRSVDVRERLGSK